VKFDNCEEPETHFYLLREAGDWQILDLDRIG